ncbi:hypothetical protein COS74_03825 [bacterium CG06_land_8_20_14_3_00_33_50]|nr:MAG: hypothetical protein COU50_01200 [bacterium CG10_big_fil_rev_8_21_14_0_10_33_18]PIU76478.1 MAG: hypothetical protein COS74_03825 [bacterium CG06_land_8_20_14_3_00_33_50]PIW81353.1 MAG: hypothetical protein COZ97_02210 [bacterium CG_4_8_14_3_um_filter_33_28]PIY85182.1 MAG: hypothetical protein COY76_03455 [bacterium CG_4_10_14_0_8_um_filter_33_57]PJA72282.1 MAG: hypothetical protein CO152_02225 [bacterium CG_4_9_14_3_um_filter_33_26]
MYKPVTKEEEIVFLLHKIARTVRKKTEFYTEFSELSIAQTQAMVAISLGKSTMKELAEELNIAFPTTTILTGRLVKGGYVTRKADKNDRRIIHLSLTNKGTRTFKKVMKSKMNKVKLIFNKMSEKDKKSLCRILSNLLVELKNN